MAPAVNSGGASQGSVRSMIHQLNRRRGGGSRSPSKRPREESETRHSSSSEDETGGEESLTLLVLQREMKKLAGVLAEKIDGAVADIRAELRQTQQRVDGLERHVEKQNEEIETLYNTVGTRDDRIRQLEEVVEEVEQEKNAPFLCFDGSGVPASPTVEPWKEDVTATVLQTMNKYMPDLEVSASDIVCSYRVARGKKVMCKFAQYGKGSVRDKIYESRVKLAKTLDGQPRDAADQLYVNEVLPPRAYDMLAKLRAARKRGVIHNVFTSYGHIFVKIRQHGAKMRVKGRKDCDDIIRGEW